MSWAHSLAWATWLTASTCISLRKPGARESRTLSSTRPSDPREGAAGDHVAAGRLARAVIYGDAGHAANDGWEPDGAHADAAGSGLRIGHEVFPGRPAADDVLAHAAGAEGVRGVH